MASKKKLEQYILQKIKKPITFTDEVVRYTTVDKKEFYVVYETSYGYDHCYGCGYKRLNQRSYNSTLTAYTNFGAAVHRTKSNEVTLHKQAVVTSEAYRVRTGHYQESIERIEKPFLGIGGYYLKGEKVYDESSAENWRSLTPEELRDR